MAFGNAAASMDDVLRRFGSAGGKSESWCDDVGP